MKRIRRHKNTVGPHAEKLKMLSGGAYAVKFYKDAQRARAYGDEYRQSESLMMMLCALTPLVKYGFDKWEDYKQKRRHK